MPLDGRSANVRREETNLGNMLADATRAFFGSDIALVNSGAIRCNRVIMPDTDTALLLRDVIGICPFENTMIVKRVTGQTLISALENSVSDAHTDGRFLQVSGLRFTIDWARPEGSRVLEACIPVPTGNPESIQDERMYTVAMAQFIASGFDGYVCFQDTETIVDGEGAISDTSLLLETLQDRPQDEARNAASRSNAGGLDRAREAIIHSQSAADGLPVVSPKCEGRITAVHSK